MYFNMIAHIGLTTSHCLQLLPNFSSIRTCGKAKILIGLTFWGQ
jgi:hypothetical protein